MANPGDMSWSPIERLGDTTIYDRTAPGEVVDRCRDAEAIFVNKVVIDKDIISRLPKLRFIGVMATGYNNVDTVEASAKGITVCNVPAYSTDAVAQTVFSLLLETTNKVGEYSQEVNSGKWADSPDFSFTLGPIMELSGKTMGIYGLGNIGMKVARIADSFGMTVVSPTSKPQEALPPYINKVSFDDFLSRADVVSLNAPLTDSNRRLFCAETFGRMKRGVIIINTARGPLIDENDLADALRSGQVGAAGLDVLEKEPPRNGSPLIGAPNCFITPHVAWQSTAARKRLIDICGENMAAFMAGRPINVVNA